jgi:O-methyltransferase involved in polyketide biosynthesis
MYLTSAGVDATLAFIVKNAAPGSAVVFDYIYEDVLEGSHQPGEVRSMRRYRFMSGEGLTFGIPKGTVAGFLHERGFRQVWMLIAMIWKRPTLLEKMPVGK